MASGIFDIPTVSLSLYHGYWNGLTFGDSTDFHVAELVDLFAFDSRLADTALPQADGDMAMGRWAAGRLVTIPFTLFAGHADWLHAFEALDPYEQYWLAFRDIEGLRLVRARVVRRRLEVSALSRRSGATPAVVELKLADPRVYDGDAGVQVAFVPFGAGTGGGFELPVTQLPLDMVAGDPGSVVLENAGQAKAWPIIRIYNPTGGTSLTSVTLENLTNGDLVQVDTEVVAGQTLTIDMDRLVRGERGPHIHIDGATRYGSWVQPRELFGLDPGLNELVAEHTGGDPVVRLDWLQPTL